MQDVHALADAFAGEQSDQSPACLQSAADKATQQCKGVSKREILAANWPLVSPYSMAKLEKNLGDVSRLQWLQVATVGQPGAAGKESYRWNPAILASCLCNRGRIVNKAKLVQMFETQFPEYLSQWEEIAGFMT